jgi:hypothetical protein
MNNIECVVAVLARHREARHWTDEAVAANLLAELGLDPTDKAAHATAAIDLAQVTEDQVTAAEKAAEQADETARELRARLNDQNTGTEPETDAEDAKREADRQNAERAEADRVKAARVASVETLRLEQVEAERVEAERLAGVEKQRQEQVEADRIEAERAANTDKQG